MNANKRAATGANFTVAPVEPAVSPAADPMPEFGRLDAVERFFGIKRGPAYKHIRRGDFKSVLLREPGAKNGLRLVHLPSVRAFLAARMEVAGGIDTDRSERAAKLRTSRAATSVAS